MTSQAAQSHAGELALRRFRIGETFPEATHIGACGDCRARVKLLDEEQRRFEQDLSFDRFAAGVERAARTAEAPARKAPTGTSSNRTWRFMLPTFAVAAGIALFVAIPGGRRPHNEVKGGGGGAITVRVSAGDTGPQRSAAESVPEALAPGERVRIGYKPGKHRYVLSLSIDERGKVTPIYPEAGHSLPVGKAVGEGPQYLPDSIEFTDAGTERLFVVMSEQPIDVDAARRAARASYERAKRDILKMPPLELPGEQFQRTFLKP